MFPVGSAQANSRRRLASLPLVGLFATVPPIVVEDLLGDQVHSTRK